MLSWNSLIGNEPILGGREVLTMWLIFAILLVVWVLGIHFYVPFLVTLAVLAAMLTVAGLAMLPASALTGREPGE